MNSRTSINSTQIVNYKYNIFFFFIGNTCNLIDLSL